jgi:spermidine synthase
MLLFFCSGTSALIYQVLWLRLLALVFGVTVWAASTVIASFMAGLALGSFGAGRLVDRVRQPLLWFGIAEAGVGLSALATPWALDAAEHLYTALYHQFPESLAILTVARFSVSMVVLLVPTTLMGATLPIVVKSSVMLVGRLGERVSLLYAINTTGAIVGTLLAGFYLVGSVGIARSFELAATVNVAISIVAALLAQAVPPVDAVADVDADDEAACSERARRLVLGVFILSGFTSMAQEVIWVRLLVFFQAVNTYAFTIMLAAFLGGIALGSFLAAPLMRRRDPLPLLAGLEIAIGASTLLSLIALTAADRVIPMAQHLLRNPYWETLPAALASILAVLPTTTLMGLAFPIGLRLWAAGSDGRETGRRIGVFYSLNVLGSIGGAVAAGFVLLPLIGSYASLIVVAGLSVLGGIALLAALPRPIALRIGAAGLALFAAALWLAPDPYGVIVRYRYGGHEVLWREEGVQTTVWVHRVPDGTLAMFLDGHNQATDGAGAAIHRMIGTLPVALHPSPREALVIGLAGGATAGAVARYPGVHTDVVELSGGVARGSEFFRRVNDDVLHRPTTRLLVADGRNHLMMTDKRYDVITADIIWPYHAGAGNLYSREYFELARGALTEDGIMLQWVGALKETQHKLVMRTFLDVFPDATLWGDGTLLVGTKHPLRLDPTAVERKLADPATRDVLAGIGVTSLDSLVARYWAGPDELRRYVGPGPLLRDNKPAIEYFLSLPTDEPVGDIAHVRGDARRVVSN